MAWCTLRRKIKKTFATESKDQEGLCKKHVCSCIIMRNKDFQNKLKTHVIFCKTESKDQKVSTYTASPSITQIFKTNLRNTLKYWIKGSEGLCVNTYAQHTLHHWPGKGSRNKLKLCVLHTSLELSFLIPMSKHIDVASPRSKGPQNKCWALRAGKNNADRLRPT